MRIVEVVEPGRDGVFRHVEGLVRFLLEKECEVDLAYSSARSSADLHRLASDVQRQGGTAIDLGVANAPGIHDLPAAFRLLALVKRRKPDLIHAHSSKAGALVRLLAPFFSCPVFYTPHAYYSMGTARLPNANLFRFVEKQLGSVGTTINISEDEARYAREAVHIQPARQRIIHNPVDHRFFGTRSPSLTEKMRREFGIPQDGLVLGTVGRFAEQKDPETLYRAFAIASKKVPSLFLAHLGEGPLRGKIKDLAADLGISTKILFMDYRDSSLDFYQAIDALAMSSRYEAGWPIAILEALAQDLPVITTTCPGCSNIPDAHLSHCWTSPVADPEKFANAIEAWVSDRAVPRPSNHRKLAAARFSSEVCYGAVLDEYRHAISKI